jgi:hypothetical protein
MAYSLLASESASSADTNAVTSPSLTLTGASLIVVAASWHPGASEGTISDSVDGSSGWDTSLQTETSAASRVKLYFKAASLSGSRTVTYTTSSGYPSIGALVFGGAHASPYTSQESGDTSASTTASPGSLTPSEANCLVVSGMAYNEDIETFTIPTPAGWTVEEQRVFVGGTSFGVGIAYQIQTTATATNPAWTLSGGSADMAVVMAVFKAAAGSSASSSVSASTSSGGGLTIVARNVLDYDSDF